MIVMDRCAEGVQVCPVEYDTGDECAAYICTISKRLISFAKKLSKRRIEINGWFITQRHL